MENMQDQSAGLNSGQMPSSPNYYEYVQMEDHPLQGTDSNNASESDFVPGCGVLGMGFDIRRNFFTPSLCKAVSKLGEAKGTFRKYAVPENVRVIEKNSFMTDFKTVSSREEFNNHFAAKAGLTVNSFAFDGEFNAAYKEIVKNKAENFYSFYQYSGTLWSLTLEDTEPLKDFLAAVKQLPEVFTPEKANAFFTIFKRFGTHYIDNVTMGGNLVMYTALSSNEGYSSKEFSASMKLEYEGLFTTVKGEASTKWKQINENMFKQQTFNLFCNGGDASVATAGINFNANYNDQFTAWLKSCDEKPSIVNYSLTPIAFAAPIEKQDAILDAIDAYTKGSLHITSSLKLSSQPGSYEYKGVSSIDVYIGGKYITPPSSADNPNRRITNWPNAGKMDFPFPVFRLTLFTEKAPYKIIADKVYYAKNATAGEINSVYDAIFRDVQALTASLDDKYNASFSATATVALFPPTENLVHWLKSLGAGKGLNKWTDSKSSPYGDSNLGFYTCAGKANSSEGTADEDWSMLVPYTNNLENRVTKADSLLIF